ncbi:MAG: hypothetical protein DRN95_07225, partial [Candidatus Hydrothermarchaeota archaeon]
MVEFRIDVIVDPKKAKKGMRQVDKGLVKIGNTADNVRNSIQRLFAFGAIAFAVKQVLSLSDAYTNLQNRLRVVTKGQADLVDTTEKLLAVSNRSRSGFEATAELYSRVALATRDMGTAQKTLVGITETVNKAIILSGASAKEANNGLIQLSQGIASNRLGGDELRSVLEQLPVVADVIAKQMGVTRGEMRALGAEGKITGDVVIEAFKNAREEIEQRFAKTVPTLGQSFQVLRNNVLAYLGSVDTSRGVTRQLGNAMRFLGENINFVTKSLLTFAVVFASIKLAPFIQNLHNSAKAYLAFNAAVKSGNVVILGSAVAEKHKAAAALASLHVERQYTIASIARAKAEVAATATIYGSRNAIVAQVQARTKLKALEASTLTQTNALAAAQARFALASTAANKELSIAHRILGKVRSGILAVNAAIAANPIGAILILLTSIITPLVIFRNEIQLAEDNLATLGDLGVVVWDRLKMAFKSFTDFFSAAMTNIAVFWGKTWDGMNLSIENVLLFIAAFIDTTVGLFKGLFNSITAIWGGFPRAFADFFIKATNGVIDIFETFADGITAIFFGISNYLGTWVFSITMLFRSLGSALKLALAGSVDDALSETENAWKLFNSQIESISIVDSIEKQFDELSNTDFLPKIENAFEGGVEDLGKSISDAFAEGLKTNTVANFVTDIIGEAERLANARVLDKFKESAGEQDGDLRKVTRSPQVEQILKELEAQEKILSIIGLTNQARTVENDLLKIRKQLEDSKVKFTEGDIEKIRLQLEYNQALKDQLEIVNEIRGPIEDLLAKEDALTMAFLNGRVTIDEYNLKMRDLAIQSAEAGTSIADGITRGIASVQDSITDLASSVENVFV